MMQNQDIAIHVDRISKSYGSFRAVDHLSFDVYSGEIFAMLGPNGAGKSTTIRMILDIMKPDSGKIEILGGPITDEKKDRIGYLPEERGLYRDVKVIDMMVYLGTLKGMSESNARQRAMELLKRVDLESNANQKTKELSKGMQQKVQFAVSVMHDPDVIIIDEPFSGLDPINTLVIKDLILELKDRGAAIIMSTHQMYQVEEMADRLLMISRGQQALYGPVDEVRRQHALHAVVVEGRGDWSTIPGIERVVSDSSANKSAMNLFMTENTTPNDVLASIASNPAIEVDRFELAVPSLNDIFIQVAGEDPRVAQDTAATEPVSKAVVDV